MIRPLALDTSRVRGFSLVEMTVVLVVLGLISLVLVQFLGVASQQRREAATRDLLVRADDALLNFAMVHGRLPCPAGDSTGVEDCATGQVGTLPYRTIGLPDANARLVRYGVLRRPASRRNDADLTQRVDRFDALHVVAGGIGTELPVGNINGIDLCWALRTAEQAPADAAFLHLTRPLPPGGIAENVAYALALPKPGERFGGQQAGGAPAFDPPRRPTASGYHDRVLAVGIGQLWSRMRCGDTLASASNAHFNIAASIALMHRALQDYKTQLAIAEKLAEANVANGAAAVLSSAASTASASATVADTVSEGLASKGIVAWRVALAAAGVVAAVAVTVTAGVFVGYAETARRSAEAAHDDIDPLIADARHLETSVLEHARTADAIGLY